MPTKPTELVSGTAVRRAAITPKLKARQPTKTNPPNNPLVDKPGYKPAIYTVGHRNGHSMTRNPETGEMWVTEQGPNGGDEINVLKPERITAGRS